ncbi:MAG: hypothetical protein AAFU65_06960, partial [Pseudomonadota bacterium]
MRQLVLTLLFLAALVGLALLGRSLDPTGGFGASTGTPAPPVATDVRTGSNLSTPLPNDASPLALRLSPRLGAPGQAPATATAPRTQSAPATTPAAGGLPLVLTWRPLILLALAGLTGIAVARFWPRPVADAVAAERIAPSVAHDSAAEAEPAPVASDHDPAEMDRLSSELTAARDDLTSMRDAHAELLEQVRSLDDALADSQQKTSALESTLSDRDLELLTVRSKLEDITRHDEEATSTVTDLSEKLSLLDNDGVEQRVINVQFEKALLAARADIGQLAAQLDAANEQLRARDERIDALSDTLTDAVARSEQSQAAASEAADAQVGQIETLSAQIDTLSQQLDDARGHLEDREARLAELA